MSSGHCGVEVPIPTLPLPLMIKRVEVATVAEEDAMRKRGVIDVEFALPMVRLAYGVVVPIPTFVPVLR